MLILAIINKPQLKKKDPEGEDVWLLSCAFAYLLGGLSSISYAHSCNFHSSEEEYFSEGDDLED